MLRPLWALRALLPFALVRTDAMMQISKFGTQVRIVSLAGMLLTFGVITPGFAQASTPTQEAGSGKTSAQTSVVRKGAPEIVLPSHASALEENRGSQENKRHENAYEPVILRGGLGHVPSGRGACVIDGGNAQTTVTYESGLPHTILTERGDAHRELTTLKWSPDRVQLLQQKRETQTRGPASQHATEAEWKTHNWFLRHFTWDEFRRPHTVEHTQEGGERSQYECAWESLRQGTCDYRENLRATVQLTPKGEVQSVQWSTKDRGAKRRALEATWNGNLLTRVTRSGAMSSVSEKFRYNDENLLLQFDRRQRVLRGTKTMRWRLKRDHHGNVIQVERRCFGACAGIQNTKIYDIVYDDSLDHTFCGAWWDDGIDPTLHGW